MYEPLPFEFLYTNESEPQVLMTVNGVEVACTNLDCNYNYVAPEAQITGLEYTGTTLTITGENFKKPILKITLGNIECKNVQVSSDNSTITCQVTPAAGSWKPVVIDTFGIIPVVCEETIDVSLSFTDVTPKTDLNPVGGTVLHITGNHFPESIEDGNTIVAAFSDGTGCVVESTSLNLIVCVTEKFPESTLTETLILTVNGITAPGIVVTISPSGSSVTSITPNSVSPVLKSILTIAIQDFPNILEHDDLSVWIVSRKNSSIVRYMNIIEIGNESGN